MKKKNPRLFFFLSSQSLPGWSLCKGKSPLSEGDNILLSRSTHSAHPQKKRRGYGQKVLEDTIVRFTTSTGKEVGRLPKEVAKYIARLLDRNICTFKGKVVYCSPILTIGEDIIIQLNCYFSPLSFKDSKIDSPLNPFFQPKHMRTNETDDRYSRDGALALLGILRGVGLKPSRSAIKNMAGNGDDSQIRDLIEQAVSTIDQQDPKENEAGNEEEDDDGDRKEVSDGQLDVIYEKAQMFDAQIQPMDEPDSMCLSLKPYQKRALAWMFLKESTTYSDGEVDMRSMHPLWEEYTFPIDSEAPENIKKCFYINPYSGELSLTFPESNSRERGGILADEMGLGKTIEMLSLIHTNRFKPGMPIPIPKRSKSPTTLVVCPMTLLAQWRDEIIRGSKPGTVTVEVYYGDGRNSGTRSVFNVWDGSAPDVLITTYGTVMSEWEKPESKLFNIEFWRVVLDEAHHIKNRQSKTSQACCALKSQRRWALSGTPIQNKLEDLFSLVKFLRHEPWSNYTFWRTFITIPFEKKNPDALVAVKRVLEPIVLRRTKLMRDQNGDPMVALPDKKINIEYLDFTPQEQEIYDSLYKDSKTKFSYFCASGKALSNYASIFQLLMRLRQVSCHPSLVINSKKSGENNEIMTENGGIISLESLIEQYDKDGDTDAKEVPSYSVGVLQNLLNRQKGTRKESDGSDMPMEIDNECPICFETVDSMIMLKCAHMACRPCVMDYLQKLEDAGVPGECPLCRQGPVNQDDLLEISQAQNESSKVSDQDMENNPSLHTVNIRRAVGGYKPSTKINAMLSHIRLYQSEGRKTVVFSQFTSFLDIIQIALQEANISFARLDGSQSQAQREKVLSRFSSEDKENKTDVLLISLRAGGVGLNLTCTNRVLLMDPWWNFAVEAQAIDRVHRLGQTKDVVVTRFIMKDTVEERILDIQDRKHVLTSQLYMSKEEAKVNQLQDLQILFSSSKKSVT
ncbi:SNF2 family N-terminal domain-containing protein [Phycomyces nitens]|nr:SNF2 family N-terminal domain-containing protein [Phycomyces nitens]